MDKRYEPHLEEQRNDLMCQAALRSVQPLVEALVRDGVSYTVFSKALKNNFVQAAEKLLQATGAKVTDSAVSVLSGVHRKDLRAGTSSGLTEKRPTSVLAEVFTRWATDPTYHDAQGKSRILQRTGPAPSFEALAESITRDIHPSSLLDSLLRMKLVEEHPSGLHLSQAGFVPKDNLSEMLAIFADNIKDHVAAGALNLQLEKPKFLEHSIYADELTAESVAYLHGQAVNLWSKNFEQFASAATARFETDKASPNNDQRLRFGVYFYAEPMVVGDVTQEIST